MLPLARQYRWPSTPDFDSLGDMVEAHHIFFAVVDVYCRPENTILIRDHSPGWVATRDAREIVRRVREVRNVPRSCG